VNGLRLPVRKVLKVPMRMMTDRQVEMLRRGGIDPIRLDRRSLSEILNDHIPYERWARDARRKARK
jgi:hypothetical protein